MTFLLALAIPAIASAHYLNITSVRKIARAWGNGLGPELESCRRHNRHQVHCDFVNNDEMDGGAGGFLRLYSLRGRALLEQDRFYDTGRNGPRRRASFEARSRGRSVDGKIVKLNMRVRTRAGGFQVRSVLGVESSLDLDCSDGARIRGGYGIYGGTNGFPVDAAGRFSGRNSSRTNTSTLGGRVRGGRVDGHLRREVRRPSGVACDSGRVAFRAAVRVPPPYIVHARPFPT